MLGVVAGAQHANMCWAPGCGDCSLWRPAETDLEMAGNSSFYGAEEALGRELASCCVYFPTNQKIVVIGGFYWVFLFLWPRKDASILMLSDTFSSLVVWLLDWSHPV